ncbi:MAG: methyltransferase domain-containing protein [Faecalibacterium sp.]|nr:methyltransferase domain-containing protein [Ruminococcus sp.]MCM1392528.1 methyltransferase domain-containing protein [Ruminococcus sp.]MCM1486103.1 methyltransferase domain-containing protein [Faecalibacterium sp.]
MNTENIIICPVCSENLDDIGSSLKCTNGHCFDKAKEGYVNMLVGKHKSGNLIGDNKDMARSRQAFLGKEYFSALADALTEHILSLKKVNPAMLDICCGEGYYSKKVLEKVSGTLLGFDISKEMVRLAAKRKLDALFFVANLSHIPIKSNSIDIAFHLFAPFHESEFSRILKSDGNLISVIPGENHLFELKQAVYDKPYKNDEKPPETTMLKLTNKIKVSDKIQLTSNDDIQSLFQMTPYYYRTSPVDRAKLDMLDTLETTIEFLLCVYGK